MRRPVRLALALVVSVVVAAGCGGEAESAPGNPTDRAFASQVLAPHERAIEMAELALRRAEHPELKLLARRIIRAQRAEVAVLRSTDADLRVARIPAGELGLQQDEMNVAGDVHELGESDRFDRSFIEMMVPHHESAVKMAAVELRNGRHPRLRRLAEDIVDAQRREIDRMKERYIKWYRMELPEEGGVHGG
jgi:uncharacterized protein (DUF305 family)